MCVYRIYYTEAGFRELAGTLRERDPPGLWEVRFKNGFQRFLPDCQGTFEYCRSYLTTCFHGVLQPATATKAITRG